MSDFDEVKNGLKDQCSEVVRDGSPSLNYENHRIRSSLQTASAASSNVKTMNRLHNSDALLLRYPVAPMPRCSDTPLPDTPLLQIPKLPLIVIRKRSYQFLSCIHYKRTMGGNGLVDGLTTQDQHHCIISCFYFK